jgi:hypothetical protein
MNPAGQVRHVLLVVDQKPEHETQMLSLLRYGVAEGQEQVPSSLLVI